MRRARRGTRSCPLFWCLSGRALTSGVELQATSRTTNEKSSIVVTLKFNRGDTSHNHRKTKSFVCTAMTTQPSSTSAAAISTSEDHVKCDIAVKCLSYQQQLATMELRLQTWKLKSIFMMPFTFRPSNPNIISGQYTNILGKFREVLIDRERA